MAEETTNILDKWKQILAAIAGILLVALQVINVLLSNDIDHTLGANKAQLLDNSAKLAANRDQLEANSRKLLDALSQTTNGYENGVKKLLEAIEKAKPTPTPR